jgi:hypothetical protein
VVVIIIIIVIPFKQAAIEIRENYTCKNIANEHTHTHACAQKEASRYFDFYILFSSLILEIGNNLSSKYLNVLKVTFSPEPDDKVVRASLSKAL